MIFNPFNFLPHLSFHRSKYTIKTTLRAFKNWNFFDYFSFFFWFLIFTLLKSFCFQLFSMCWLPPTPKQPEIDEKKNGKKNPKLIRNLWSTFFHSPFIYIYSCITFTKTNWISLNVKFHFNDSTTFFFPFETTRRRREENRTFLMTSW